MTKIVYHIVEHDDGWAYQVDGVFSETFPSHDAARRNAPPPNSTCPDRPAPFPGKTAKANGTRRWRAATTGPRPRSKASLRRPGHSQSGAATTSLRSLC